MTENTDGPGQATNERVGLIDAIADLMQSATDWVRQEAEAVVREKVVKPIQRLGLTLTSAAAAAALFAFGMMFIAVGAFLLLGDWIGYPYALFAVGGVYVLLSFIFLVVKIRMMQR